MASEGSVTCWLDLVKAGDAEAAQKVWERYFGQLVRLARGKLGDSPRRVADEEDVALSALDSFFRDAREGRFPRLNDRQDLWQVLVLITANKVADYRKHLRRKKRGGDAAQVELAGPGDDADRRGLSLPEVVGCEPTPEFAVIFLDEIQHRLRALDGIHLARSVAVMKMEGFTHEEIAANLGCSVRTVDRKLMVIRKLWLREDGAEASVGTR